MPDSPHRDPVQQFADRIIAELENGVKPWVRPWDPAKAGGPQAPFIPVTDKRYHGINVLNLGMDLRAFQSGDPRSMTYQQSQEKQWQVRKGEKATTIFFMKPYVVEDDETEDGRKTIKVPEIETLRGFSCVADRGHSGIQIADRRRSAMDTSRSR
jgi:antirestriction protein ArdC